MSDPVDPATGFPADLLDQPSEQELLDGGPVDTQPVAHGPLDDEEPPF